MQTSFGHIAALFYKKPWRPTLLHMSQVESAGRVVRLKVGQWRFLDLEDMVLHLNLSLALDIVYVSLEF